MSEHSETPENTGKLLDEAPLGHTSAYPSHYDAGLLFPIPRSSNRASLGLAEGEELPFVGLDLWQAFEVSWLDMKGKPIVRLARFAIPANSENLIESKSFKLYLNGYNQTRFHSEGDVQERLEWDLTDATGAEVVVTLYKLGDKAFSVQEVEGTCIDDLPVEISEYEPDADLLGCDAAQIVEENLCSHLLKSNCPVTGQPDWGSVEIFYRGPRLSREGLLKYIVSYRGHQDFHEHCVERIYQDLYACLKPDYLAVMARYTRRGGLDINPCRASSFDALNPKWLEGRTSRQ
ncbi:NADPH-dependent 7-cyano-7-deazaguanine reductase [Halomonadaceae bacterium LMG 33818]|uniref:NADPH-dependent 7-cyano-7-deazaguanine reductase QueF n=1 Tax=Cernens ardua TaxID=3402176 RepID=UPI003EDB9B80